MRKRKSWKSIFLGDQGCLKNFLVGRASLTISREGDKIVLEGEADQVPDQEPGSIIFNLVETEHSTFHRAGADLSAEITISLTEALCGFSRIVLKHLDGRGIYVNRPQSSDRALKPGTVLRVAGEGMPYKKSDLRGDLYLVVNVEFPDAKWLRQDDRLERLKKLLPKPEEPLTAEITDEVEYDETATLEDFGSGSQGVDDEWEDDEGGDNATEPQCAQQ